MLNLLSLPIYLHVLGVESLGLIGLSLAILVIASLLDGGMATTINREMVRFKAGQASSRESVDLLRTFETTIFGVGAIAALAVILLAPEFARHWLKENSFAIETVVACVVLMSLSAIMRVIEAVYRGAMLGLDLPATMNVLAAGFATLRVIGPVPLVVFFDGTILTFFALQAAVNGMSLVAFYAFTHGALEGRMIGAGQFRSRLLRANFGFAGTAFVISSLTALINQLDKLYAAKLVPLADFGYYSLAAVLATSVYQLVLPIFQSFYPRMSHLHAMGETDGFDASMFGVFLTVGLAAGVPLACIIPNAEAVLFAFTGDHAARINAAPLLAVLCVGTLSNALFHAPLATFLALGRQSIAAWTTTVLFVLLIPAMATGWHIGGLVGLATAWSTSLGSWLVATLIAALWKSGRPVPFMLRSIAAGLLPFCVALLLALALKIFFDPLAESQFSTALAVIISAAMVAVGTAATLLVVRRATERPKKVTP